MQIKNGELEIFAEGLVELLAVKTNAKVAFKAAKSAKVAAEAVKDYLKARTSLIEASCKKDENGKPIVEEDNYTFESEETKEAVFKELDKLNQTTVELPVEILTIEDLKDVEIAGSCILKLKDLISES